MKERRGMSNQEYVSPKVTVLALVGTVMVLFAFFFANDGRDLSGSHRYQIGKQVVEETSKVRLLPSWEGKVTNRLYRGQRLETFEVRGDWARISPYYDGAVEGVEGPVARWIWIQDLRRDG